MALPFKYNGQSLLDGSHDGTYAANKPAITIQVSADNDGGNYIMTIELGDFQSNSATFGLTTSVNNTAEGEAVGETVDASDSDIVNLENLAKSQGSIERLDEMIGAVINARSDNLMNSIQNTAASMSTIRDADFAIEASNLACMQILTQSGTAMLAQANQISQNILSLLQ